MVKGIALEEQGRTFWDAKDGRSPFKTLGDLSLSEALRLPPKDNRNPSMDYRADSDHTFHAMGF